MLKSLTPNGENASFQCTIKLQKPSKDDRTGLSAGRQLHRGQIMINISALQTHNHISFASPSYITRSAKPIIDKAVNAKSSIANALFSPNLVISSKELA